MPASDSKLKKRVAVKQNTMKIKTNPTNAPSSG
jgi:hypothetical protein